MQFPNPYRGLRGLPTDVWIIFATTLVNRAGMMALPFLVLYLTKEIRVSAPLAGLALGDQGLRSTGGAGAECLRHFPAATAYTAELAPEGRTGEYMGGLAAMFSLSLIVGPWAGTTLLDQAGSVVTWSVMFGLGILGAILLVLGGGRSQAA